MPETKPDVLGVDHVQITAPRAREADARAFYGGLLGLQEIPKPAVLVPRGGAWYRCGRQALHLGLEDDFTPQARAHPAFLVRDLDALCARLESAGIPITTGAQIPGYRRCEARDPFGNRLEFLQRQEQPVTTEDAARIRERVQAVFGPAAEAYVASPVHARGDDLARLVELAAPRATDVALDIATGGGHTALALASRVARVVASDLTPAMLAAARAFIRGQGIANVDFTLAEAEHLPFLDATFDLVTVRIAPHHFADCQAAVREMTRVLVPGGRLVVVDNIAPEDAQLAVVLNRWEAWRDPSHVRCYALSEWRGMLAEAGLLVTHAETGRKTHAYTSWVERTRMPVEEQRALAGDMLVAPESARRYFEIVEEDGRLLSWSTEYAILCCVK
jgi:ubiquinone/menaquinone biosynthesis C-methylase UbiE/catechol 2,3-dioxygenase-like lactoylglutathione lyase family enzyme